MKKFLFLISICFLSLFAKGEVVKMALLQPRVAQGSAPCHAMDKNMVRGELRNAFSWQSNFQVLTRTDIDQMLKEQGFQQSGMVSDTQRAKVGVMTGAQYICVSTLTKFGTQLYIEAYLINIETGEQTNAASQYINIVNNDYSQLPDACNKLAEGMLGEVAGVYRKTGGNTTSSNSYGSSNYGNSGSMQNQTFTVKGVPFTMIYVEGGSFTMGCTEEQSYCGNDENPIHRVMLDSYYIGETEVTQELWRAVMGDNPSYFRGDETKLPVEKVSWEDCQLFITLLNRMTGRKFRLPTEAEWEYAARGGRKSENNKYAGAPSLDYVGWYSYNSGNRTHEVKSKSPNELGIYDMSGNVWEWCQDWYGSGYYSSSPQSNPTGPSSGSIRVLRGGSWYSVAKGCRVAYRDNYLPSVRSSEYGFRLVLVQ